MESSATAKERYLIRRKFWKESGEIKVRGGLDKDSNCEGLRSHFDFLKEQGTRQRRLSERETCGKQSFRKIKLTTVCVGGEDRK